MEIRLQRNVSRVDTQTRFANCIDNILDLKYIVFVFLSYVLYSNSVGLNGSNSVVNVFFHSWWAALFPKPISGISDFFGFDALQTVSRTNFLNPFPYKRSNCKLFVRSSVLWPICSNDDHWKRISHTHTNSLIWNRIEFVSETKFSSNLKYAKVFKKRSHLLNFTFKKKKTNRLILHPICSNFDVVFATNSIVTDSARLARTFRKI